MKLFACYGVKLLVCIDYTRVGRTDAKLAVFILHIGPPNGAGQAMVAQGMKPIINCTLLAVY